MINAFLAQLFWAVVCGVAIFFMIQRANRRMDARERRFWEEVERTNRQTEVALPSPVLTVSTALSDEIRAIVQSPSPALERNIAALNAIVETGEIDEDDTSASSVPIDLGGLAERLSEAGYDGGALKLTRVEVRPDRHVVVHLEPQRP